MISRKKLDGIRKGLMRSTPKWAMLHTWAMQLSSELYRIRHWVPVEIKTRKSKRSKRRLV